MLFRSILLKSLRDRRVSLFWWSLSLFLLVFTVDWVYPSIKESAVDFQAYVESFPEAFKSAFLIEQAADLTSPTGFLNAELFSLMLPLMFIIFAIGFGSSAIAGEEEAGTLDLLLANPVPRWRVVVEKFLAMAGGTVLLGFVLWLSLLAGAAAFDMDVGASMLAAATTSSALLGLSFGVVALAVGCATGKRSLATALAIALTTGSYLLNVLAQSVESLKEFDRFSLFYYQVNAKPLVNGLQIGDVAILVGVIAVFLALALLGFQRRDLAV